MKINVTFDSLEEFQERMGLTDAPVTGVDVTTTVSTEPAAETKAAPATPDDAELLDSDGMPWCGDYHAETKAQNGDGTWKARKGKAEEAKQARAAFKAAGGNVTPPATTGGMPGTTAGGGLPGAGGGLPGATQRQEDMPPPVSQADLEAKIIGMMERGTLDNDGYVGLLTKHGVDLADPTTATATNESLRAAIMADCFSIEPAA